jgi:fumarate hydratase class II
MKSKVTKKGDLCVCITDADFPQNDTIIDIHEKNGVFPMTQLKPRIYIKIENIGSIDNKDTNISARYKERITQKVENAKKVLEENGVEVTEIISKIKYKNNTPVLKSQRASCKLWNWSL